MSYYDYDIKEELPPGSRFTVIRLNEPHPWSTPDGEYGVFYRSPADDPKLVSGYILPEDSRYWARFIPIVDGTLSWDSKVRAASLNYAELSPLELLSLADDDVAEHYLEHTSHEVGP